MALALACVVVHADVVTFTGHAAVDFASTQQVAVFPDAIGDVSTPLTTVSGWDVATVYVHYDADADTLFVGIHGNPNGVHHSSVIIGDADGDGNPSAASASAQALNIQDRADLGADETVIFCVR